MALLWILESWLWFSYWGLPYILESFPTAYNFCTTGPARLYSPRVKTACPAAQNCCKTQSFSGPHWANKSGQYSQAWNMLPPECQKAYQALCFLLTDGKSHPVPWSIGLPLPLNLLVTEIVFLTMCSFLLGSNAVSPLVIQLSLLHRFWSYQDSTHQWWWHLHCQLVRKVNQL